MIAAAFVSNVWWAVIAMGLLTLAMAIAFQVTSAELRSNSENFAVVKESRSIWLGNLGVLAILGLLLLSGVVAIGLRVLSVQLRNSTASLLKAISALLVSLSPAVEGLRTILPGQR